MKKIEREKYLAQIMDSGAKLIVELRENRLSKQHYPVFIQALKQYREIIRGERLIERELASALHILEIGFISALDSTRLDDKERDLLSQVHQEFVPIMMDILNPAADTLEE